MGRVDKTWVINNEPADVGTKIFAANPLVKSLTLRYPGEDEKVYDLKEKKASGAAAYFRIIQMLTAHMAKKERMEEIKEELLRGKYAITSEEQRHLTEGSGYRKLSEEPYPDLPEIWVNLTTQSSKVKADNLKALVASLEETWRAVGETFPTLEVRCGVNGKLDVNDEHGADGETAVNGEPQDACPFGLNTILFGPPGTGKTYLSRVYAVAIADGLSLDQVREKYPFYEKQQGEEENETGPVSICGRYEQLEKDGQVRMVTFHQAYGYEEFIQGIRPVMQKGTLPGNQQNLSYEIRNGAFTEFCEKAAGDPKNSYIFLIDEINRGNIAKIFGELITLIEPSKRKGAEEELPVRLPYDGEPFSVPKNVYLLGTMNTADRSLVLLDTALRRRFDFVEMMPGPSLLVDDGGADITVGEINVKTLLTNLNNRLELLIDREHTIGHAFFLPLKKDPSIENLARIMKQKVIPLLQEFFYDDYGLLRQVLGGKIVKERTDKAFTALKSRMESKNRKLGSSYVINCEALESTAAYDELLGKETDIDG